MRKIKMAALVAVMGFWSIATFAAGTQNSPAASKARFEAISANVDTGGDLLVVANFEGLVEETIANITGLIAASGVEDKRVTDMMAKLPGFLKKNGFYSIEGIGMSTVPTEGNLSRVKFFVSRDPASASAPLWRALIGNGSTTPVGARFLPADTVFARVSNGELNELWKMIRSGASELGGADAAASLDRAVSGMASNQGVDLDKVFASLGNEGFFSIQLSTTATFELPGSEGTPKQMPQPSFLLGIAVKDDTLVRAMEAPLERIHMPLGKSTFESIEVSALNLPMPFPFPVQPAFAVYSNYFLMGSSTQVVTQAIASFKAKNGLAASPEFVKAFAGLPAKNNGMAYLSPRFMKAIIDLQAGDNEKVASAVKAMWMKKGDVQSAFVIQNLNNGVLAVGNSSSSGKELVGGLMMAPIGILAGVAIPSFVKARSTAQNNACINNLRQIDSAKEQWALAERKADGDAADIAGISQYIKGNAIPLCPAGGVYSVNAIGENPVCNKPGHALPSY